MATTTEEVDWRLIIIQKDISSEVKAQIQGLLTNWFNICLNNGWLIAYFGLTPHFPILIRIFLIFINQRENANY